MLDLIERAELDITNVALAIVTDQYLAYLRTIEDRDPAEVSAFLVIAAKLVQIKSEALLPRPVIRQEGEEDLGESLARQLIAYRRYKQIAVWLNEREEANLQTFLHVPPHVSVEERVDLSSVTLADLVDAARTVYAPRLTKPLLSTVVSIPLLTIRDKIRSIIHALKERGQITFTGMLNGKRSRIDVVVTFLAMLELIKQHLISTRQDALFAEIECMAIDDINETDDLSLDLLE
ncbi:MAG: segregation/condensation protein A [Anaerolineaceae bacterium]|nr:segregation/condensation protein A [Anaerolineaceae bacterium]